MRTLVVGDMHGAFKAFLQCVKRSGFDYQNDRLIVLGDVCDGYPQVGLCIDELLDIKHCDLVIGNHDLWALGWAIYNDAPEDWLSQGGDNTILSYHGGPMPAEHIQFLKRGKKFMEVDDKLFVHGGFDLSLPLAGQDINNYVWDRSLLQSARERSLSGSEEPFSIYEEIYVGHTPTVVFESTQPMKFCNIWAMDTGAGWTGKLTFMDIHTKGFWQSDLTTSLYPGVRTRSG